MSSIESANWTPGPPISPEKQEKCCWKLQCELVPLCQAPIWVWMMGPILWYLHQSQNPGNDGFLAYNINLLFIRNGPSIDSWQTNSFFRANIWKKGSWAIVMISKPCCSIPLTFPWSVCSWKLNRFDILLADLIGYIFSPFQWLVETQGNEVVLCRTDDKATPIHFAAGGNMNIHTFHLISISFGAQYIILPVHVSTYESTALLSSVLIANQTLSLSRLCSVHHNYIFFHNYMAMPSIWYGCEKRQETTNVASDEIRQLIFKPLRFLPSRVQLLSQMQASVCCKIAHTQTHAHCLCCLFRTAMGHVECLKFLLGERNGAVNVVDIDGGTPAHDAADNGYVDRMIPGTELGQ